MGWQNQILRVNLTAGTIRKEPLIKEWAQQYMGARGLATKYLWEGMDPATDPLAPVSYTHLTLPTIPLV